MTYNSTIQASFSKINFELRHILSQHPDGLTNSQVAAFLGLGNADPKQWVSYTLLQGLIRNGIVVKDETRRYRLARA
jgi:DNA-binding IclR family transcriptional regulator